MYLLALVILFLTVVFGKNDGLRKVSLFALLVLCFPLMVIIALAKEY